MPEHVSASTCLVQLFLGVALMLLGCFTVWLGIVVMGFVGFKDHPMSCLFIWGVGIWLAFIGFTVVAAHIVIR